MFKQTNALIVFIKAPVPGYVKTRLTPALTPHQAASLYRLFVKKTLHLCSSIKNADVMIAYASHPRFPTPRWATKKLAWFKQKGRLLGHRLINAFSKILKNNIRVVVIGSDSPNMPARNLRNAFKILRKKEAVIGPATDGGYYLIGLSHLNRKIFENIPWSTDKVFDETRRHLKKNHISYGLLPRHSDIDTIKDLKRYWKKIKKKTALAFLFIYTAACGHAFDASHSTLNAVLTSHVEQGRVNYAALKKNQQQLNSYLKSLNDISSADYAALTKQDKIAFWINAYNARTLKTILDHYPIKSIRQIPGVWDKKTFPVMGQEMTLDHIEHDILRKKFNEPRIHMALVCAAVSCPPLRNEAYAGKKLDAQLDDQTRIFLSKKNNFFIDRKKNVVYLSSIFDWFAKDFKTGVLNFIGAYLSDEDKLAMRGAQTDIKYLDYDWALNDL